MATPQIPEPPTPAAIPPVTPPPQIPPQEREGRLQFRLNNCDRAIQRSRWAFYLNGLASAIVLACLYNAYFSWDHVLLQRAVQNYREALAPKDSRKPDTAEIVERQAELYAAVWSDHSHARHASIPLTGLSFSVGDIGILGNAVLLVLSIWTYYLYKNENNSVRKLLRPYENASSASSPSSASIAEREEIAEALDAYFVFIPEPPAPSTIAGAFQRRRRVLPIPVTLLIWLPVAAGLLVCGFDWTSMFFSRLNFFAEPEALTSILASNAFSGFVRPLVWTRLVIETLLWIILCLSVYKGLAYVRGTANFYDKLIHPLPVGTP